MNRPCPGSAALPSPSAGVPPAARSDRPARSPSAEIGGSDDHIALRALTAEFGEQAPLAELGDPLRRIRRARSPDRTPALSPAEVEQLLTLPRPALRERTLYRLPYESAARAQEVLALDVTGLDLRNRRARVRRRGGTVDLVVWRTACPAGRGRRTSSALTHAAEDGANTSTLPAYSGHTSITSLARYAPRLS